jgi:hypothetical protein
MADRIEERVYKSLWHILIAGVGVYELRNQKTKLAKVLACGLIAFHIDGAIADIIDAKPLSRQVLEYVTGKSDEQLKAPPKRRLPAKNRRRIR